MARPVGIELTTLGSEVRSQLCQSLLVYALECFVV